MLAARQLLTDEQAAWAVNTYRDKAAALFD